MTRPSISPLGMVLAAVAVAASGYAFRAAGSNDACAADVPPPAISVIQAGADEHRLLPHSDADRQRRTARLGLRLLDLDARAIRPQVPRSANLCLNRSRTGFPRPTSNSSEPSYGDCIWSGIDGVPWEGDFEWCNDYRKPEVPVYEVAFGRTVDLAEIRLWLRRGYVLKDFDVRWRDGQGAWHTVAAIRGNRDDLRIFPFPTVQASAIGVTCFCGPDIQPTIRRITELEAYGPRSPSPNRPLRFGYRIDLPPGPRRFLEVREVYGEGETMAEVDYDVRLDDALLFRRKHRCDGPGPISYAVPLPASAGRLAVLTFVDTSGQGLAINRVRAISDPIACVTSRGILSRMIIAPRLEIRSPYTQPEPDRALAAWVAAAETARNFVQPGLLAIVGYANPDSDAVAAKVRAYARLAQRHQVPWVLQFSSWWADTPLRVPDGAGGFFGDIPYQQIGYSRFDTYDDPGLKAFMDAQSPGTYSPHYGLTVPNLWSNTPWLTMSNERLNTFKTDCLRKAVAVVNQIRSGPGGGLLQALVTDDEPIYWTRSTDWLDQGYSQVNGGVRRSDLMLDFNPAVVRAAARDGVKLDPADGLGSQERQWLHDNNARYVALICKTIHDRLEAPAAGSPDLRQRIYNYLLAQPIYPLDDYGHPGWEIGMVPGAAVGLEAGDERYFARARELGPLANSDFECANPTAETVLSWEANFRAWHDVGCSFVQLCNPGPAERWQGLFQAISKWDARHCRLQRALSALAQEAATDEWLHARYR